jgi:hypothetical protein
MDEKGKVRLDSTVVRVPELIVSELDGETVMMSMENGMYYGMNDIGSHIWPLLDEPCAVADICERLLREFEVGREQCEREVLQFLNQLAEERIIRVLDEPDR